MENATTVSDMYLQKLKIKSKKCKDKPNDTGSNRKSIKTNRKIRNQSKQKYTHDQCQKLDKLTQDVKVDNRGIQKHDLSIDMCNKLTNDLVAIKENNYLKKTTAQ